MLRIFTCQNCGAAMWLAKEGGMFCPEYSCEAVNKVVPLPKDFAAPASLRELEIHWNHDESHCEDCGSYDSDGAKATLDGTVIFDVHANAGCCSLVMVERGDILKAALASLRMATSESETASNEVPPGLHIVWEYLEGPSSNKENAWSHGARAWLDGVLFYEKRADLETCAYASHEDIYGAALFALGVAVTEHDDGYVIFGDNGEMTFGPRPQFERYGDGAYDDED